jgi:hypothetical protein
LVGIRHCQRPLGAAISCAAHRVKRLADRWNPALSACYERPNTAAGPAPAAGWRREGNVNAQLGYIEGRIAARAWIVGQVIRCWLNSTVL